MSDGLSLNFHISCEKAKIYYYHISLRNTLTHFIEVGKLSKEGSSSIKSGKVLIILLILALTFTIPIVIEGPAYEYRKGYLKYRDSIGTATFTQFTQAVNLSGQLTDVCSQLWLAADHFPPPENESLYLSRASNESTNRYWYWNSLFSEYFEQDVGQLLENHFPAISLLIWPAEMNQNISTPFFIHNEDDPREVSPFDPNLSGLVFQVSYLPWDIELVSKDPEPADYEVLDRWENESYYLEEALNALWYIETFSFSEVEVFSGDYPGSPSPFNVELLVIVLILGGSIFTGLFLYQRYQKRVPKEFAPYFEEEKSKKTYTVPPRVLERKCIQCGEVIRFQSQYCSYCGKEQ
jgi:hypothetical protein